jgi:hypothetical protein
MCCHPAAILLAVQLKHCRVSKADMHFAMPAVDTTQCIDTHPALHKA